jgi:hypothetical protein
MTTSTFPRRRALAAILVAGCLVAPGAMAQSPERGSGGKDPARANAYVPPSPDTAARQGQQWLNAQGATWDLRSLDTRDAAGKVPETANVYVPPVPDGLSSPRGTAPTQTIAHPAVPSADDGTSPWAVLGLALGGAALLGVAGLALVHRARRVRRTVA